MFATACLLDLLYAAVRHLRARFEDLHACHPQSNPLGCIKGFRHAMGSAPRKTTSIRDMAGHEISKYFPI